MNQPAAQMFDVIIVGGGSAGCVIANRLSADAKRRVLLLEAGAWDRNWLIHIPLGVGKVWNNPAYNWSYMSEPEAELAGRRIYHPRGKVIGGSSSINIMAFVRGNPADYDQWAQAGLIDWSYEKVLPYFKRLEAYVGEPDEARGASGPIRVIRSDLNNPLVKAWLQAGRQAGYPVNLDYNGRVQEGVAPTQANMGGGRRQSTAVSYLRPALQRPNLEVETQAHVERILFEGGRACGVVFEQGGQTRQVRARDEVVMCAGAYNTPQLMMLSGIGPAAHLNDHGIKVLHDAPGVGDNLQDHLMAILEYAAKERTEFTRNLRLDRLTLNTARALLLRDGPAAQPMSLGMAFLRSDARLAIPDIQMIFRPFAKDAHEWFPGLRAPFQDRFGFIACHLRPAARGTLRLASADPAVAPRIHNRFLEAAEDLAALRTGIRMLREIAAQPALAEFIGPEVTPGAEVTTDNDIDAFVRETVGTIYHPVGTCRMGTDPDSVVDERLRVRGVQGLRVADASVMPTVVGGNTNACVMMIAEKASDLIAAG